MIDNVCVIVCFYNTNPKYLEECFKSIDIAVWMFKRYYGDVPVEVHVMDDGSDNIDTINMFNKIVNEYKYIKHWKHEHNTTLATAINDLNVYTPEHALVVYIDSDDMMAANRLIIQYEVMHNYDHWKDITMCATITYTPNSTMRNNLNIFSRYYNYNVISKIDDMPQNIICHPTIAYKIDDLRNNNIKYDDNFKCVQDFEFYVHIMSKGLKILLIPDALTWWRQYPLSQRPDSNRPYVSELDKIKRKYFRSNLDIIYRN